MKQTEATGWRCRVFAYVHQGTQPPQGCPVCGASREEFDPCAEGAATRPDAAPGQWRCMVCNYVHEGLAAARTDEIVGREHVQSVTLQDGRSIPADLVVIATGVRSNTLKVPGLDPCSIGLVEAEDASYEAVEQEPDGRYFRFLFRDGVLVGAILIGDTSTSARAASAIETGHDFSALLRRHPGTTDVVAALAQC